MATSAVTAADIVAATPAAPARSAPLYQATRALWESRELIEQAEGELTPELEKLLDQAGATFDEKVERVALFTRELDAEAQVQGAIAAAMAEAVVKPHADRAASSTALAKRLKTYLAREMAAAERPEVVGDVVTVKLQANSTPSVDLPAFSAEGLLAFAQQYPHFVRVAREVDKAALVSAWKAKAPLPDGVTVAKGSHVRLR